MNVRIVINWQDKEIDGSTYGGNAGDFKIYTKKRITSSENESDDNDDEPVNTGGGKKEVRELFFFSIYIYIYILRILL